MTTQRPVLVATSVADYVARHAPCAVLTVPLLPPAPVASTTGGPVCRNNGSTIPEGKLFVMDMGADGLVPRPGRGKAFDIAYEDGERETRLDGEWRRQGLSEEAYRLRVADIEHRDSSILNALIAALRRPPQ